MSGIKVPPAPLPSYAQGQDDKIAPLTSAATPPLAPALDAGFLARTYRSMFFFCGLMGVCALLGWKPLLESGSFIGGMALAALLLRVQESVLRAILVPRAQLGGFDPKLAVLLSTPFKYLLILGVLAVLNSLGWIAPIPLAFGFFLAQLVIVAKVLGLMATRNAQKAAQHGGKKN